MEDITIDSLPKPLVGNNLIGIDIELSTESENTSCDQKSLSDFILPNTVHIAYKPDLDEYPKHHESVAVDNSEKCTEKMKTELEKTFNRSLDSIYLLSQLENAVTNTSPDSLVLESSSNDNKSQYTTNTESMELEKTISEPSLILSIPKIPSLVYKSRIKEITTIKYQDTNLLFLVTWEGLSNSFITHETWKSIQDRTIIQKFLKKKTSYMNHKMIEASNKLLGGSLFTIQNLNKLVGKVIDENFDDNLLDCYLYTYIKNRNTAVAVKIEKKIQTLLQKKVYIRKRRAQRIALQTWVQKINSVDTKSVIRIENDVDLMCIDEFHYIKERKPLDGYKVDENDPPVYCTCSPCSARSGCCGSLNESEFAYTCHSKLKKTRTAIYECNNKCKCGPKCVNRVVQYGRVQNLCIFRTPNGMGWGVKAEKKIRTGVFICEYVGEVIYSDAAEVRGMKYDGEGFTYLFDLDFDNSELYTIDAYQYGNVSRFINHSCDPNLEVCPTWVGCLDPNMPRLALFTNRDIEKGEQLTIDYNITFQDGDTEVPSKNSLCRKRKRNDMQVDHSMSSSSNATTTQLFNSETAANVSEISGDCSESSTDISETSTNSSEHKVFAATRKSFRVLSKSSKRLEVPKLNEYPKHLTPHDVLKNIAGRSRTSQRIASRRSHSSSSLLGHNRKRIRCLCKSANCRKYLF